MTLSKAKCSKSATNPPKNTSLLLGTTYLTSATRLDACPEDTGAEIAFVGRSNAGKSSAINALCHQKKLAFSSKTPGRTQMLNFFQLANRLKTPAIQQIDKRLVDLPGYGYAKTSKSQHQQWTSLMNEYLTYRRSLKAIIMLMDCRHPLKDQDQQCIAWSLKFELPLLILLSKADKLSRNKSIQQLRKTHQALQQFTDARADMPCLNPELLLFSSQKSIGLDQALAFIKNHLQGNTREGDTPSLQPR